MSSLVSLLPPATHTNAGSRSKIFSKCLWIWIQIFCAGENQLFVFVLQWIQSFQTHRPLRPVTHTHTHILRGIRTEICATLLSRRIFQLIGSLSLDWKKKQNDRHQGIEISFPSGAFDEVCGGCRDRLQLHVTFSKERKVSALIALFSLFKGIRALLLFHSLVASGSGTELSTHHFRVEKGTTGPTSCRLICQGLKINFTRRLRHVALSVNCMESDFWDSWES